MIPSRLKKIVLFLFALLFFLSSAQVISILYNSRTQENAFDELERTIAAGNTSLPDRMQEADAEDGRRSCLNLRRSTLKIQISTAGFRSKKQT